MPDLTVIGTPLDEKSLLSTVAIQKLSQAEIIFAETRKRTLSLLARSGLRLLEERFYFLDNAKDAGSDAKVLLKNKGSATLLSDSGMPILFDPGREILEIARSLGFQIKTVPGPTSWGTACAVSGFLPPFSILGFLPQKSQDRKEVLSRIKPLREHTVILEAPYRFQALTDDLVKIFSPNQNAFLAWEIGGSAERYAWGTLREIQKLGFGKGEFVIILQARS